MTKNGKNVQLKNLLKYFLGSKIAIYLYLGFYKGRPRYRRSLQTSPDFESGSRSTDLKESGTGNTYG
jgi:hypothetical protein